MSTPDPGRGASPSTRSAASMVMVLGGVVIVGAAICLWGDGLLVPLLLVVLGLAGVATGVYGLYAGDRRG